MYTKNTAVGERVAKIEELGIAGQGRRSVAKVLGCTVEEARYALDLVRSRLAKQPAPETAKPQKPEKPKPVRISAITEIEAKLKTGKVNRFILTAAQDDTPVFKPFLENLEAYGSFLNAPLLIAGYTYQKGLFEDHAAATAVFDPALRDYVIYDRVRLSPNIMFIADANILPTTAKPLNGWATTNLGQHVVVPSARIALQSIPRAQGFPARFATSTGCCTLPSYAPRAAGRKSIARHTYGALLVEIDVDGEVFFRHLVADKDGSFQDLNSVVKNGIVSDGFRVAAITWGDIHYEHLDHVIARTAFGFCVKEKKTIWSDSLYERLMPENCYYHDSLDFRRRNHHNIHDPHLMAEVHASGKESVEEEVADAANFINEMRRPWCRSVMVESNHDSALAKWGKSDDGRYDPANSYYWHWINYAIHDAIRRRESDFNIVEFSMRSAGLADDVVFVPSGGSDLIRGVEHGFHGDLGISGARGTPTQFTRFGIKCTTDHTHTPGIIDDVYTGGVSAKLDQGYNKGGTTWAHAHVVLYSNGTRVILVQSPDGRYEATGDREEIRLAA
ncbi:hypothetical protein [Neorhizobium tomejilense]|uniref:hypothetical protein n=1 Tax=Neorhizobium tomejilense TaxID=2093828 RepID=UPI003ECFC107